MVDRCFIAVDIEELSLRTAFLRVQDDIVATRADVKCVEPENIHITLKFFGELEESKTLKIAEVIQRMAFKPFKLNFKGVGVFPALSRPSVIWAGVTGDVSEMLKVFSDLEKELKALGFEPERRPFSPHITLCRVRSGKNRSLLATAINGMENESFGELEVKTIKLKKSILTRSGPIYNTIAESRVIE
jgi:2'-5' RNA ligase